MNQKILELGYWIRTINNLFDWPGRVGRRKKRVPPNGTIERKWEVRGDGDIIFIKKPSTFGVILVLVIDYGSRYSFKEVSYKYTSRIN